MKGPLVFLVFLALPALGGYVGVGTIFELGWDAWDVGMAGAGLALAEGPGALFTNPAGIAWEDGIILLGSSSGLYGAATSSSVAACLPGVGLGGIILDSGPIDEGLRYRVEGAAAALSIPLSEALALGGRARVLRHVLPQEETGWAVDLAVMLRGPLSLAALAEGLVSQAPVPEETWPPSLSLGVAMALPLPEPLTGALGAAVRGLGEEPLLSLGAQLWAKELGIRAGYCGEKFTCGLSVGWGSLRLSLATELHATLPPSFKASFQVILR
ncbi:hypothetical protein H5T52_00530 [Candidatus Bipolaricaulota bacterium]|nr:hypothetical protein [Candidatus Bipolaricaulota bacterium]